MYSRNTAYPPLTENCKEYTIRFIPIDIGTLTTISLKCDRSQRRAVLWLYEISAVQGTRRETGR